MNSRRSFLKISGMYALSAVFLSDKLKAKKYKGVEDVGVQLYTVHKEMLQDNVGTLKKIASLGYKEVESAASEKGSYYGFKPVEMKKKYPDVFTMASERYGFKRKAQY